MENSEMMVSKLLAKKEKIEKEIRDLQSALEAYTPYVYDDVQNCISMNGCSEHRFIIDRKIMLGAIKKQLELKESELNPVLAKLDAIELMLRS